MLQLIGKTLTAKVVNMFIGLISHQAALSNKPYNVKIYQSNLFAKLSASDYKYKDVKSLTRTNANPLILTLSVCLFTTTELTHGESLHHAHQASPTGQEVAEQLLQGHARLPQSWWWQDCWTLLLKQGWDQNKSNSYMVCTFHLVASQHQKHIDATNSIKAECIQLLSKAVKQSKVKSGNTAEDVAKHRYGSHAHTLQVCCILP